MPITLLCPRLTCRAVLKVPDHVRGKRVRCGECGITLVVPGGQGEAPAKGTPAKRTPADQKPAS